MSTPAKLPPDCDAILKELENNWLLRNANAEIKALFRNSLYTAHSGTDTNALLALSEKACSIACQHLKPYSASLVFYRFSEILYEYFAFLQFDKVPEETMCSDVSRRLKKFRKMTPTLQIFEVQFIAKVNITFLLCLAAFQYSIQSIGKSHNTIAKAMDLADNHLGVLGCKTLAYGRASFQLTRLLRNRCSTQEEISVYKDWLETSFDAISHDHYRSTDDTTTFEFYCLVFEIAIHEKPLLDEDFLTLIHVKLLNRRYCHMSNTEWFLLNVSLIWIVKLLGKKKSFNRQHVRKLKIMKLQIPNQKLLKPVIEATLALFSFKLIPDDVELKKTLFSYVRDLTSRNISSVTKIRQLNILTAAITFNEDLNSDVDFYLSFLETFISAITKEKFSSDCTWFYRRLCIAHIYFSFFYAETERYDKGLYHAKQILEVLSKYTGDYDENLEVIKTTAFYISTFAYHKMRNYYQTEIHLDNEIKLLEKLQPQQLHRLLEARKHKEHLDKILQPQMHAVVLIPDGLVKLFSICPAPTQE